MYDLKTGVKEAYCTCPRGTVACHHMAATLYYGHYHVGPTDIDCQWSLPSTSKSTESITKLATVYPKKKTYRATKGDISENKIKTFQKEIGESNVVGFSWLLKPEPKPEAILCIPDIEEIILSEQYMLSDDKAQYLSENCKLQYQDIIKIEQLTRGQHQNENWHVARKHRLTSSKFGLVLSALKRNKFPPSLFKNLMEGYNLSKVAAVQWGKTHEQTALEEFSSALGLNVEPTGLW